MAALGINIGYLLMQIAGITILLILLNHFAYGPILKVLDERKARLVKQQEDARQAAVARENAEAEAKKILDAARAEAAKIRQDEAIKAEETAKGIRKQANDEAADILTKARSSAEEERNNILAELRGQVAAISIAAANKLVGASLDDKRQRELITEFFAKAPAKVSGLSGDSAEVTSALPLTGDEQSEIKKALKASNVNFKVNPNILGGLIIRVGDQIVDDSVASRVGAMRDSLA